METAILSDLIRIADIAAYDTREYLKDRIMDIFEDRWNEIFNGVLWQIDKIDRVTEDNLWHLAQDYKYKIRDAMEQMLVTSLERMDLDERAVTFLGGLLDEFAREAKLIIDG